MRLVFYQFTNLKIGAMSDVFLDNLTQTVHKVYHETSTSPFKLNVDLIHSVGQLEEVTEEELMTDGKIRQLYYRYVKGGQTPKAVKQWMNWALYMEMSSVKT